MNTKELIQEAEKLELDAKALRKAADVLKSHGALETAPYNGTRAEQLEEFIANHGGKASRTDILSGSGIPVGTIASLLGYKKRFTKDGSGMWRIKKNGTEVGNKIDGLVATV